MLTEQLGDLWVEFLDDARRLEAAVMLRMFSRLPPLEEYMLEAGELYLGLLDVFCQRAVLTLFQGPVLPTSSKVNPPVQAGGVAAPQEVAALAPAAADDV